MSGANTTFRLTEFVLAISPPICERSYEHVKLGNIHSSIFGICPFRDGRPLTRTHADFLGPSAARNLIMANFSLRMPSRFSNIIFVSYNREGPCADAPPLPRNEKLLTDPVRLRQITERIPAARW